MEDDEIRAALRRGDVDDVFRRFARAHGRAAYEASYRISRNARTAEDATQEALLTAFRKRAKMLEIKSLRGWLIAIAVRKSYDAMRSARRLDRVRAAVSKHSLDHNERDAHDQLASAANHRALEKWLATLAPDVHAAVLLRFREDYSWDDIAKTLDVSLDVIRMRVQRGALKCLKASLEAESLER